MCAWCYAFRSSLTKLLEALPKEIEVIRLLGGLARDTDEPMPEATKQFVISNWERIEQTVPDVRFNYDFWTKCKPRRSTYPACRAVIAARIQGEKFDSLMTEAIQNAYYSQARNPSDISTLIELAEELGLGKEKFTSDLNSEETNEMLIKEIKESRSLGLNTFPSLLLDDGEKQKRVEPDYINTVSMLGKLII